MLRLRNQRVEVGALQRLEHGRPIHGEVVRLRPRPSCPLVCDVDVQVPERVSRSEPGKRRGASQETRAGPGRERTLPDGLGSDLRKGAASPTLN